MKRKVLFFLGMVSLFLFVLTFAIGITINFTPLYRFNVSYLDIPERVGLPAETIMENYRILLDYLNLPWITELNLPDFPSSESGLFHFYEVKQLFLLNYSVLLGTAAGNFFFIRYIKRQNLFWKVMRPFQFGLFVPFFVLILIMLNFETLFVLFHQVFFNNDAWIFNASTDPIILALPETFFMHCFILAFILIELQLAVGYVISKRNALSTPE